VTVLALLSIAVSSEHQSKVRSDFLELRRRCQENLVTFLTIEVDLATTFCWVAESADDRRHRAKLLEDAQKAVSAIRHFGKRIIDTSIRAELNREADRLDSLLRKKLK
jgi:hypothetical protein